MNITPELPINEDTLINFSVEMAHSVLNNSRRNYLSGIWHYLSSHGYELTLATFLRQQLILRGIKRSQGVNSKIRRPISLQLLSLFLPPSYFAAYWQHKFHNALAAMKLAFFGFLQIGELTCNLTFDPKYNLMKRDITFMPWCSPKYMLVHLKVSNTDPFRLGQTIDIGKTNLSLCPISGMVAYRNSRPFPSDSLSPYKCGAFLTWEKFTRETRLLIIKKSLNSTEFAGRSFRIGAATAAASAGLPPWLIKVLGRWSPWDTRLFVNQAIL